MARQKIRFDELRALLLELGFHPDSETRFEHPVTKTILLFPAHRSTDPVSARDMLVLRRQLVDNGLIEDAAFDQFLQQASA
jgi:hypothetical protein